MSKFTPGPWKVWAENYERKDIEIQHNGKVPIIKWAGFDEPFRKHSEHLANAHLIAAAPHLLETLKRLTQGYENLLELDAFYGADDWIEATKDLASVGREAIAAAEKGL
jgi:hypothetical protein